jgi:uncharacterized protein (TIGR02300 family)
VDLVSKPEWGTKRICAGCGAHFYDMRKSHIACPKCKAVYDPEAGLKSRRRVPEKMTPVKPIVVVPPPPVEVEAEVPELVDEEEDAVIEDTSELGTDETDISEAIEKVNEEPER